MSGIKAVATFADVAGFPEGSSVSAYRVSVTSNGSGSHQDLPPGVDSAVFDLTAPGDYVGTIQALDANGNAIGQQVTSNTFTIAAPVTVSLSMPSSLTLGAS